MAYKGLTPYERETLVLMSDGDNVAQVHTFQRKVITKLKKNPEAVLVGEGSFGNNFWAKFELPAELVSFRTKTRARPDLKGKPVGV